MKNFNERVMVLASITVATLCALLQLLGVSAFNFPEFMALKTFSELIKSLNATKALYAISGGINIVFMVSVCSHIKMKLEIWLLAFILSSITQFVSLGDDRILPILLTLILGLVFRSDSYRNVVFRYINIMFLMFVYQAGSAFYKFGFMSLVHQFTIEQIFLFNIDNYVLLIAIYIDKMKGGNKDVYAVQWWRLVVYPFVRPSQSIQRHEQENSGHVQERLDIAALSRWDKVLMVVVAILQLGLVTTACAVNGKLIVFLIMYCIGFIPQRISMKFSYHAKTILGCTIQSLAVFFTATALVPQVGVTVLIPVCVGTAIVAIILTLQKKGVLRTYG